MRVSRRRLRERGAGLLRYGLRTFGGGGREVLYRLDEILLIALAGCLAGAGQLVVEMAGWARLNLEAYAFDPAVRARRAEP